MTPIALKIIMRFRLRFAGGTTFMEPAWHRQTEGQVHWPFVFQAWVQGFRMQLFMLVSGFCTAMLWRHYALLAQRFGWRTSPHWLIVSPVKLSSASGKRQRG